MDLIAEKILKECWENEKNYPWAESGICVFVWERAKILTALKLLQSFFRRIRNVKVQTCLPKHLSSFTLETDLKMEKITTDKGEIESICARVTENTSKKVAKPDIASKCLAPNTKDYYYCIHGFLNLIYSCGVRVWGLRVVNVR